MRTFVIGDLHGAFKALKQCFERSGFDPKTDRLITLGDICDGYLDVRAAIDVLIALPHCVAIRGNHDHWALEWALTGTPPPYWLKEGGANTVRSYEGWPMPKAHVEFLKNSMIYLEENGRLYVHGGFDPETPVSMQSEDLLIWDRSFLEQASRLHSREPGHRFAGYEAIFLGHTPTQHYGSDEPIQFCNVWELDTGAGWSGRLSIMDVETKEFWQSDPTPKLYDYKGRG